MCPATDRSKMELDPHTGPTEAQILHQFITALIPQTPTRSWRHGVRANDDLEPEIQSGVGGIISSPLESFPHQYQSLFPRTTIACICQYLLLYFLTEIRLVVILNDCFIL